MSYEYSKYQFPYSVSYPYRYPYQYTYFSPYSETSKIRELPWFSYAEPLYESHNPIQKCAESFLERIVKGELEGQEQFDPLDFLQQKSELQRDRIELLLEQAAQLESVKYQNLSSLYNDLFKLDLLEKERPFPQNYAKDQTWLRLNEDRLRIYESIRRELREHHKSASFLALKIMDALLEYKQQKSKSQMLGDLN